MTACDVHRRPLERLARRRVRRLHRYGVAGRSIPSTVGPTHSCAVLPAVLSCCLDASTSLASLSSGRLPSVWLPMGHVSRVLAPRGVWHQRRGDRRSVRPAVLRGPGSMVLAFARLPGAPKGAEKTVSLAMWSCQGCCLCLPPGRWSVLAPPSLGGDNHQRHPLHRSWQASQVRAWIGEPKFAALRPPANAKIP